MRLLSTFLLAFFCLGFNDLQAQSAKDATVPITATLNTGPTSITLNWVNPGNADLLILRRTKGQAGNGWVLLLNVTASNFNQLTDNGIANGQIYEYVIQRTINGVFAFGYAHIAVNANPVNSRGKILIFVDSTTADALGPELVRLKNDMRGDGWWPIAFHTGPNSTVQSIKNQIVTSYNADPLNVKSVLLLGSVPIPYSGDANWDGHAEHAGAWPADSYYADIDGVWTDVSVNNVTPARAANDNVPGDGKFDQSFMPSAAELQVGRVDFRRLNAPAFGATDAVGLMKRYLDKNHKWRIGDFSVQNKALVDDNFGFFGGEAFAANGFRNAYPLVGEANVVETDFFDGTESQSYLLGYGTGGGTYQGAGGVGTSANFATDSVNIVFSNLFGSYHGDWDFETDPFMPAALASRGGILTCSWAGRPHWFNQALASGETIGYCTWETMNAQTNNGFFGSTGESGAHVALLGDPSLRANVVKPATDLALTAPTCNSVALSWTASAEAVAGYHVYRAPSQDGAYTRLTTNLVTGTTYTDNAPPLDTLFYQVRAIKNVTNPGGGTYANNAIGPIKSIVFTGAGAPAITTTGGTLNCTNFNVTLTATGNPPIVTSWNWVGPNNYSSSLQNPTVTNIGTYTVTALDATGCSATATATVLGDYTAPTISSTVSNTLNCASNSATINVDSTGLSSCIITGPGNLFVQGFNATVTLPGNYSISVVSAINGCIANGSAQVVGDISVPSVTASTSGPLTCVSLTTELIASSNVPGASFLWSGPCVNGTTASCKGIFTVIVTNLANGCTNTATTTVTSDLNIPQVSALDGILTCDLQSFPLIATSNVPNATFNWSGPCVSGAPAFVATCPGTYTVVGTNPANGCTASTTAVVTEDVQVPNISFIPPAVLNCTVLCVDFTVPLLPSIEIYYLGQLVPPNTSIQFCQPGDYSVTVKSTLNGCTDDVDLVIMQDVTQPTADAGADQAISCGSPSVQLNGNGSPNVTYLWSGPGIGVNNETLQNPIVTLIGVYTLVVTNPVNGCTASDQTQVFADASLPTAEASVGSQIDCLHPFAELLANTNATGATYLWTGPNGYSSDIQNSSTNIPGIYTLVVTAPNGCSNSDVVEVFKAPDLVVTSDPSTVDCDGVATACVNVSGGTAPYSFLWSNGNTTNCSTFTGGGMIGVMVSDAGGCSFQSTQTIVVPPALAISVDPIVINCNSTDVEACVTVTGGVPPYNYAWSTGDNDQCAVFSTPGVFGVSVTDEAGCVVTANPNIVQPPPAIALSSVVVNESAPNANNGSIDLSTLGGTPPYTYLWSNGATTQDLTGLAGGVYTVTVTDGNGCTKTSSATVNTSVDTEEVALFAQFQLSPNPTEGLALLSLQLYEAAALRVEIRDVAGRLIWENPTLNTDALNLPIDLTNSPAGMYSVSVWVENQVFVRKLAVVR